MTVKITRETIHGNPGEKRVLPIGAICAVQPASNLPPDSPIKFWAMPVRGWPDDTMAWAYGPGVGLSGDEFEPVPGPIPSQKKRCARPGQIWVGYKIGGGKEIFRFHGTPTQLSHGDTYAASIGPFRTVRGAAFMVEHGTGNPHCVTVAQAERLGKKYASENRTPKQNTDLIERVTETLTGEILHTAEMNGTVAVVEQCGETRFYHAREFYRDSDGNYYDGPGYSTPEKHWYMGERYRNSALWGEYFGEVFKQ